MFQHKELGLTRKFSLINQELRHLFDAAFKETGITGKQAAILHYIYTKSQYEGVFQRDIEKEFNIRRSSVTSLLQGLEIGGFIVRENAIHNPHQKKILLTEKANYLSSNLQSRIDEMNQKMLSDFSEDERNAFTSLLDRICINLME